MLFKLLKTLTRQTPLCVLKSDQTLDYYIPCFAVDACPYNDVSLMQNIFSAIPIVESQKDGRRDGEDM